MAAKSAAWYQAFTVLLATVSLPLAGALIAGEALNRYLQFPPPLDIPRDYPRFSWLVAGGIVALLAAIALSWRRAIDETRVTGGGLPAAEPRLDVRHRFPSWGWCAVAWTLAWWVLAWTRFPWFEAAQRYTFFPLWIGFIVTVNAGTHMRAGKCLMRRATGKWLALFVASAGFWWIFEWLNRFVRNWHYLAVDDFGPLGYALNATVCFSTVLPAVAAVREWLGTWPQVERRAARGPAWRWIDRRSTGWVLLCGGLAALLCTGWQPMQSYPALWVAPLALAWAWAILLRRPDVPAQISRGDWRAAAAWMLAALLCGFWWELWNWHSLAKWIYTVPYVQRWHVFEMPLLGYAGYLPFGLECLLVAERIVADRELTSTETYASIRPRVETTARFSSPSST